MTTEHPDMIHLLQHNFHLFPKREYRDENINVWVDVWCSGLVDLRHIFGSRCFECHLI